MKNQFLILLSLLALLYACNESSKQAQKLSDEAKALWQKGDYKQAVPLYVKAAKKGNAEAQFIIGQCYKVGRELKKDKDIAKEWFLKSAEQNYPEAQQMMAILTASNGDDRKESTGWIKRCAGNNYPGCMSILYLAYEWGTGTEMNYDSMQYWLKRLALLDKRDYVESDVSNIAKARFRLGEVYNEGKYVTKDSVEAFAWFLLYNECKRVLWLTEQENNILKIQEVEKQLTIGAKDVAKKKAESILGKPLEEVDNLYSTN